MDIAQKTVLVTGASRGIGRAILERTASLASFAIGTATSQQGADEISRRLEEAGAKGKGMVLDLRERGSIEPFLDKVAEEHGEVDVLVNNAGIAKDALLMRVKDEDLDTVLAVNLVATLTLCRKVLRGMLKKKWGRIVNVSSVVASAGNSGQTIYSASKAALEGFTRSLAEEVGAKGVTVNAVAPGFIDTDMTRQAIGDAMRQALLERIPLGRMGRAEEIAAAVNFLCSGEASYVTGATLHVNGGLYMD